jgi:signal transduction histidine kinase
MIEQKLKLRHPGFALLGLFLAGLTVGLTVDLARDMVHPARARTAQLQKLEIALQGDLELERAVQALKDCILRGDAAYSEDFVRHLHRIDQAVLTYRSSGPLDPQEQEALTRLYEALPKYQAAIYSVRQMRATDAPINEIDMAVKGRDRPIAAAFHELEAAASGPNEYEHHLFHGVAVVFMCMALSSTLLYFSFGSTAQVRTRSGDHDQTLKELSDRIICWEEERESRAFSVLHDGVCQSLSAVMYLLKSAERPPCERTSATRESNLEPVVPSLQDAIRSTLEIALDLRPPRLQESGLLATLDSLWAQCWKRHPGLQIVPRILLHEEDVPRELKPVILRIARTAVEWAIQQPRTSRLVWNLARDQSQIHLSIGFLRSTSALGLEARNGHILPPSDLTDAILARILLAGGASEGVRDIANGQEMLAVWRAA